MVATGVALGLVVLLVAFLLLVFLGALCFAEAFAGVFLAVPFLTELFFQLMIVGTGNYAWINVLGVLPCCALVDDEFLTSVYEFFFGAPALAPNK